MGSRREMEKKGRVQSIHGVPAGNGPYVRAKHLQLVDKDHKAAIPWFWKAINAGDRVDSALKDMAVAMKKTNRVKEGIEAITSFRHLCSSQAQDPLDNLLIDLFKKCGRLDEQIHLYKRKLRAISEGEAFNGKATKTARSHGKKLRVSVEQETARILGNLGWAYMQQSRYEAAELVYRKAQQVRPDANMACNLGHCLIGRGKLDEAGCVLDDVVRLRFPELALEEGRRTVDRAEELMGELGEARKESDARVEEERVERLELVMGDQYWTPLRSRRLPIFEEISMAF